MCEGRAPRLPQPVAIRGVSPAIFSGTPRIVAEAETEASADEERAKVIRNNAVTELTFAPTPSIITLAFKPAVAEDEVETAPIIFIILPREAETSLAVVAVPDKETLAERLAIELAAANACAFNSGEAISEPTADEEVSVVELKETLAERLAVESVAELPEPERETDAERLASAFELALAVAETAA